MKRWVVVKRPLVEVTRFGDARPSYLTESGWEDPVLTAAETALDAIHAVAVVGEEYAAFEVPTDLTPVRAMLELIA